MTPNEFRKLALSFAGVTEGQHIAHPDFRVGDRIFATLGAPDGRHGMVQLLPEQQELAMEAEPGSFKSAAGAWGRGGSTFVMLETASDEWVQRALHWAWELREAKNRKPNAPRGRSTKT